MIKKTINYIDYDGNERSEEAWFNLSQAEIVEMNMNEQGGLEKVISRIISEEDNKKLFALFKNVVLTSYGKKSDDGRRFMKSEELSTEFSQTEAYSKLMMELLSGDAKTAEAFINGLVTSAGTAPIEVK